MHKRYILFVLLMMLGCGATGSSDVPIDTPQVDGTGGSTTGGGSPAAGSHTVGSTTVQSAASGDALVIGHYTLTATLTTGTCASAQVCPSAIADLTGIIDVNGIYWVISADASVTPAVANGTGITYTKTAHHLFENGCDAALSTVWGLTVTGNAVSGTATRTRTPACDNSNNPNCLCNFTVTGFFTAP